MTSKLLRIAQNNEKIRIRLLLMQISISNKKMEKDPIVYTHMSQ